MGARVSVAAKKKTVLVDPPPPKGAATFRCAVCRAVWPEKLGVCRDCGARMAVVRWDPISSGVDSTKKKTAAETRREEARRIALLDAPATDPHAALALQQGADKPLRMLSLDEVEETTVVRLPTGERGIDRVVAGGFVRGYVYAIYGPPGAGKSRFCLRTAVGLCAHGFSVYGCAPSEELDGDIKRHVRESGFLEMPHVKRRLKIVPDLADVDAFADALEARAGRSKQLAGWIVDSGSAMSAQFANGADTLRYIFATLCAVARTTNSVGIVLMHENKQGEMGGQKFLQHAINGALLVVERVKKEITGQDDSLVTRYVPLPKGERSPFVLLGTNGKNRFGDATRTSVYEHAQDGSFCEVKS